MKKFLRVILTIPVLCAFVVQLTNCGGSDSPGESETDRVKILLKTGPWKLQTLTVDDVDKTTLYENLTLTFTNTNYTTTDGGIIWPASGGWSFTDDSATHIRRSDDVVITIRASTATQLVLSFDWAETTIGPGRKKSLAGEHVFTFGK